MEEFLVYWKPLAKKDVHLVLSWEWNSFEFVVESATDPITDGDPGLRDGSMQTLDCLLVPFQTLLRISSALRYPGKNQNDGGLHHGEKQLRSQREKRSCLRRKRHNAPDRSLELFHSLHKRSHQRSWNSSGNVFSFHLPMAAIVELSTENRTCSIHS